MLDYARFVVIRVFWFRQKKPSELTRILNDECKFEYVHLHCLQILYELKIASFEPFPITKCA